MYGILHDKFDKLKPFWQIVVILALYTFVFFLINITGQLTDYIEQRTLLQHLASAFGIAVLLTAVFDRRRIKQVIRPDKRNKKRY
jgi:succinate dehydrogenase hydrophobic anchor subunit